VPRVTALTVVQDRVAVELDSAPWRMLPAEAVVEAGLSVGVEVDRDRARSLRRALRRAEARRVAIRALERRDHTRASLGARLERAGVAFEDRNEVVASAERGGLVDDERFAEARAGVLARRGAGDMLVFDDLARHGVAEHVARSAVASLEPESRRAERIVAARGRSARTVRYLVARGFTEDTVERFVAELES
jgi:SOS response regulatory protein OraA/RecX